MKETLFSLKLELKKDGKYFRASRGGSGALYSQSAIVRVMFVLGTTFDSLPVGSGVDAQVLRNRSLRTVSGSEGSSTKQFPSVCCKSARAESQNMVTCRAV